MESQLSAPARNSNIFAHETYPGHEHEKYLFSHQIELNDSLSGPTLCLRCLNVLGHYSSDAFASADVLSPFGASILRPLGRRLHGLRLRLEVWMVEVGIPTSIETAEAAGPDECDFIGQAVGRKINKIGELCNAVGSSLQSIQIDLDFVTLSEEGRSRTASITATLEKVNQYLDNIELVIRDLTGLAKSVQMSQAIKSGSGPYGNIPMQVESIANDLGAQPDAWLDLRLGEGPTAPISDSSGESVFTIKQDQVEQRDGEAAMNPQQQPQPALQKRNYRVDWAEPQEKGESQSHGGVLSEQMSNKPEHHDVEDFERRGRREKGLYQRLFRKNLGSEVGATGSSVSDEEYDHPDGYPKLARFMATLADVAHVRSFCWLQMRVILYHQDQLRELEHDLLRLDGKDTETAPLFLKSRVEDDRRKDQKRRHLILKIDHCLSEYERSLSRARALYSVGKPSQSARASQMAYLTHTAPLTRQEEESFFEHGDDVIKVFPLELTRPELAVQSIIVSLLKAIQKLFIGKHGVRKYQITQIFMIHTNLVKGITNALYALFAFAFLIGPTLTIVLGELSDRAALSAIVAFTIALGSSLLIPPGITWANILAMTAGYYGLHVLFWTTFTRRQ